MNNLIQITKTQIGAETINSVNAREIHSYLEVKTRFNDWIQRAIEKYDFEENIDYSKMSTRINGACSTIEYIVTLDMAKELSMLENNAKGRETRKYFISIEKEANKPLTVEQLLQENVKVIGQLQNKVITLQNKVIEDKPKVQFANAITGTTSNIDFETFAKALFDAEGIKMGRNKLMQWFRDNKYLTPKNKPYQVMLDRGLMTLKEGSYVNQSTQELITYTQPRISGKGQLYFTNKLLDEREV